MKKTTLLLTSLLSFIFLSSALLAQVQLGRTLIGEDGGDQSGWAVAISSDGNRIAVGAPNNPNIEEKGHIRVFEWQQIVKY
jgi:hypothetical protein